MPTRDELFYWEQRRKAIKKQRDQSQRQAAIDRTYALRASAVMEAELARLMAMDDAELARMMSDGERPAR